MLNRRCVWLWIFVLQKEFATPPNVAFEIIGNGDANHSPPLENLPREVQLAGGTIFSNAKGTNLIFVQGNEIPTPEQNITSVRWYASHCRVLRHPTKGNMAHGETSVPAATDPGSFSVTC